MNNIKIIPAALLLACLNYTATVAQAEEFEIEEFRHHVEYLSSDELEGRLSGTPGCEKAAHYLANLMIDYGLEPLGDNESFLQEFDFTNGVELADGNLLDWGAHGEITPWELGTDWTPLHFCPDAQVAGGIIFAGYGITSEEDSYDDYAGLDVADKIVAVLRHEPQTEDDNIFGGRRSTRFADLRYKAQNAFRHGAAGLIVVTGPLDRRFEGEEDSLMELGSGDVYGEAPIPVVHLRREGIQELMDYWSGDLAEMQRIMDEDLLPQSLDMSYLTVSMNTNLDRTFSQTDNVIGMVRGSEFPDEYIVIGAHYDHLGHGQARTSLPPEELAALEWHDRIHHGADDNASGTAAMLQLARHYAENGSRRSLVFMGFSGEELGILGSLYFVRNSTIPLENTVAMLNMDMIGRVRDNVLTMQGLGSAEEWQDIVDGAAADSGLEVKRFDDGVGGSD